MTLLFSLLESRDSALTPSQCKVHLATPPDSDTNLLQLLAAGEFDEWQSYQTNRIFSRKFVVALIQKRTDRWVFAGACAVDGMMDDKTYQERDRIAGKYSWPRDWTRKARRHRLRRLHACDDLIGTIVRYRRDARSHHRKAERLAPQFEVHEDDQAG